MLCARTRVLSHRFCTDRHAVFATAQTAPTSPLAIPLFSSLPTMPLSLIRGKRKRAKRVDPPSPTALPAPVPAEVFTQSQ